MLVYVIYLNVPALLSIYLLIIFFIKRLYM